MGIPGWAWHLIMGLLALVCLRGGGQDGRMTKKMKISALVGVAALLFAGCSGSDEPQLSLMDDQTQVEVPAHVAELGNDTEMRDFTYVGEGEDFSVFAARRGQNDWCVALYNEPLSDGSDDWSVSSSCGPPGDFANGKVWVQGGSPTRTHTAQLLPDNFTGEVADGLEQVNDNLAAK